MLKASHKHKCNEVPNTCRMWWFTHCSHCLSRQTVLILAQGKIIWHRFTGKPSWRRWHLSLTSWMSISATWSWKVSFTPKLYHSVIIQNTSIQSWLHEKKKVHRLFYSFCSLCKTLKGNFEVLLFLFNCEVTLPRCFVIKAPPLVMLAVDTSG